MIKFYRNLLLVFVLTFNTFINSQDLNFYVDGGFNLSKLKEYVNTNGNFYERNYDSRKSFFLGFGIEKSIKFLKTDFITDINFQYSQQGNYLFVVNDDSTKINQLNFILQLKYKFFNRFYFGTGMYFGYLLNVEDLWYGDNHNYTKFDFGLPISLNILLFNKFSLEAKYLYGFTDILNREFNNGEFKHDKYNRVIQVGIKYIL